MGNHPGVPMLYALGSQVGVVFYVSAFHLCVRTWAEFSVDHNLTWGFFLGYSGFPPSPKSTPSQKHLAWVLCYGIGGICAFDHHIMLKCVLQVLSISISEVKSLYLFNVGSSFSYETGINGSRRCALLLPSLYQCSILRVFKALPTRIRGKSKQTFKSLKIEPETAR